MREETETHILYGERTVLEGGSPQAVINLTRVAKESGEGKGGGGAAAASVTPDEPTLTWSMTERYV